jgi:hypothetical protein
MRDISGGGALRLWMMAGLLVDGMLHTEVLDTSGWADICEILILL